MDMLLTLRRRASLFVLALLCTFSATAQPAQPLFQTPFAHPLFDTHSARTLAQPPFGITNYSVEILTDPDATPPDYMVFSAGTRTYTDGRINESIDQSLSFLTGTLSNSNRVVYAYQQNRLAQDTHYSWDGTQWVFAERTTYSYTGGGLVSEEVTEEYTGTAWENSFRNTYTYNASGELIETSEQHWKNNTWENGDRTVFSNDQGGLLVITQEWNGSAYVNSDRSRIPGISLADVRGLFEEFENLNSFGAFGAPFFFLPNRTLVQLINIEQVSETWDAGSNTWVNDTRTRTLVSTATDAQFVTEEWDSTASAWELTARSTFTFANDRVLENVLEVADEDTGALMLASKTVNTFNPDGTVALVEMFTDTDEDGSFDALASMRVTLQWTDLAITAVDDAAPLAASARLDLVQPNPARAAASVRFYLPAPQQVTLRLYDVLGREVATLATGVFAAGEHHASVDVSALAGGMYLCRLEAGGTASVRSLVVAR